MPPVITAESSTLDAEDVRKRDLVAKVIAGENSRLIEVAKHLVTLSFSAVGVVLALQDKWLVKPAPARLKVALGAAVVLYLVASVLATLAAGVYVHRISVSDYTEVDRELHRVATVRYRLSVAGLTLILIATIVVCAVAIGA